LGARRTFGVDEESVGDSRMLDVMADGSGEEGERVELRELMRTARAGAEAPLHEAAV
jgi:hypothetical protein